jgi:hypothetical protein
MTRTIRPGRSAYLSLGSIVSALVAVWVSVWINRGPEAGAWQPITLVIGIYMLWCLALWQRVLIVDEEGIRCTYLLRKPRRLAWSEVRRSEIVFWIDRKPYQILIFGNSQEKTLLDIPLRLYDKADVDFLMGLDRLRIGIDAT